MGRSQTHILRYRRFNRIEKEGKIIIITNIQGNAMASHLLTGAQAVSEQQPLPAPPAHVRSVTCPWAQVGSAVLAPCAPQLPP